MISFLGRFEDGEALLALGLSAEDLERIEEGEGMFVSAAALDSNLSTKRSPRPGGYVVVFRSEDDEFARRFRSVVGVPYVDPQEGLAPIIPFPKRSG